MAYVSLVKKISERTGLSGREVKDVLKALSQVVREELEEGNENKRVILPNLAIFKKKVVKSRKAKISFKKGEEKEMLTPSKIVVLVKPHGRMKNALFLSDANGGEEKA